MCVCYAKLRDNNHYIGYVGNIYILIVFINNDYTLSVCVT